MLKLRYKACIALFFFTLGLVCSAGSASASRQGSIVYTCPMHPEIQSSTAGLCPKCEMKLVVQTPKKVVEDQTADAYTCSMHLEIRTDKPGKCPKCAMTLVPVVPGLPDDFQLLMETYPRAIRPNERLKFRFVVVNPKTGRQVKQFALMHEKLFHLFVVSRDMTEFQHIHPVMEDDGSFTIETVLPHEGHYKVYSDFYPIDGTPQVLQKHLVTAGYRGDLFSSTARLQPDADLVKTVDGIRIELKLEPSEPISGKPLALKYHLTDAKTGEPVRDLVPYLGAWGHTLILSQDQSDYVHSHPAELVPEADDQSKSRGGPDVTFEALLPRPGNYRVWTQLQRGDRLSTVHFTIKADILR